MEDFVTERVAVGTHVTVVPMAVAMGGVTVAGIVSSVAMTVPVAVNHAQTSHRKEAD